MKRSHYTIKQAAEFLGISRQRMQHYVDAGDVHFEGSPKECTAAELKRFATWHKKRQQMIAKLERKS